MGVDVLGVDILGVDISAHTQYNILGSYVKDFSKTTARRILKLRTIQAYLVLLRESLIIFPLLSTFLSPQLNFPSKISQHLYKAFVYI